MTSRIYFLDNLRTFLIFLVVLLHAGIVYEPILENTWIVSDPVKNSSIGLVRMYLDLFVMFTLFFISGYFIPNSVRNKTSWAFVKSKLKRILFPWTIAVFTLIPAYKAIFLYSRGMPQEAWFSYFHVFERTGTDLSFFANNPVQNWLWYLPVLFMFQLVYLGLSKAGVFKLNMSLKKAVGLVFVTGVIYSMLISLSGHSGWIHNALFHFQNERLLVYFMVFLLGSLCYSLKVFESDNKNRTYFILSNVVLTISLGVFTVVALNLFFNIVEPGRNYYFVSATVDRLGYYLSAWLGMLSLLYVLIHTFRFSFNKPFGFIVEQLNKNSYEVYIIHVIVLGALALPLLNISLPAVAKYLILAVLTYVISNVLVYAYRKTLKRPVSMKTVTAVMAAALLLTVAVYANKGNSTNENNSTLLISPQDNIPDIGLHEAIVMGNIEVVKQHLKADSDPDEKESSGGSSPLITAAVFGNAEAAFALIEAGADVNFKNNEGSTPLHTAAFFCRTEIVKALLANGADKQITNNAGSTALESVTAPFDAVKGVYEYFQKTLGPLGLELNYNQIKATRPVIAGLLGGN